MFRIAALLLTCTLALLAGCQNTLPKPTNANGTLSPTVALGDADLTFQGIDAQATAYITSCHAAPTTPGCSTALIQSLKDASAKALRSLTAAHMAVKNLTPGATGIDAAIADLNAALAFLQSFTGQIPSAFKGAK